MKTFYYIGIATKTMVDKDDRSIVCHRAETLEVKAHASIPIKLWSRYANIYPCETKKKMEELIKLYNQQWHEEERLLPYGEY